MPEVSVIIPSYNSAHFVTAAVESVLAQTFRDFEVLVIDDGSTDETEAVMRRHRAPVRYIRQANGGVAVARNRGMSESRGRYVAFLDADDLWEPQKLERQLAALVARPTVRACYSAYSAVSGDLKPLGVKRNPLRATALEELLTRGNVVGTPSTVIGERAAFLEAGGFHPGLSLGADWDMWLRLARHTDFAYVDEPLVRYRVHGSNMSRNVPLLELDTFRLLGKAFGSDSLPPDLAAKKRRVYARNYMVVAGSYFRAGNMASFVRCAARSVALDLGQLRYLADFPRRALARSAERDAATAL